MPGKLPSSRSKSNRSVKPARRAIEGLKTGQKAGPNKSGPQKTGPNKLGPNNTGPTTAANARRERLTARQAAGKSAAKSLSAKLPSAKASKQARAAGNAKAAAARSVKAAKETGAATPTAKLVMHGRSQAVRLPKDFRFEGNAVRISRQGRKVILEPLTPPLFDLDAWLAHVLAYGSDDFPDVTDDTTESD